MILKHILLWRMKQEVREKEEEKQRVLQMITESVSNMNGKIKGLRKAEIGEPLQKGEWDFIFYSEFISKGVLEEYQEHPLHIAHREMASPYLETRLVFDYEIEDEI